MSHRIITLSVLAGAYANQNYASFLTHAFDEETEQPLCKRVRPENLADPYAGDIHAPPTCPICLKRDPRFHGRATSVRAPDIYQSAKDEIRRGEQVSTRTLLRVAEDLGIEVDRALARELKRPGHWARRGASTVSGGEVVYRAVLERLNAHTPNASYYVWVVRPRSDTPLSSEGPYGPHPLTTAEQMARIAAKAGAHDRVVSRGRDPESASFRIERRYAAMTGDRLI